jgi:hypothetical protein
VKTTKKDAITTTRNEDEKQGQAEAQTDEEFSLGFKIAEKVYPP